MNYITASKHAKKITDKVSDAKPVLQGVYHKDNTITAVDGHRLLKVELPKVSFEEHVYDLKRDIVIENGTFPNTESILNGFDNHIEIPIEEDVKVIREMLKLAKTLKYETVQIKQTDDNKLVLKPYDKLHKTNEREIDVSKLNVEYILTENLNEDKIPKTLFDINYVLQIFDFIQETKSMFKMIVPKNSMKTLGFKGADTENYNYTYLVMPYRDC